MLHITTPSRVALAMMASAAVFAALWAVKDHLPTVERSPATSEDDFPTADARMLASMSCIRDDQLREGIVIRGAYEGGRRYVARIDQDGNERLWMRLSSANVWCTSGEPTFLHGRGRPPR